MKCNKCQSEWNGVKELDTCPFCGANLKPQIKDKDFQSVGEFLSYVISAFGLDVLRDGRKLVSLFADLAPTLEQEKNLLRIATESGVYKDILSVNSESDSEKQACVTRCKLLLESKYFMQSEWSEKAILWLTDYLGWKVKVQTAAPPKPVQPVQQPVVQQVRKPVTPPVQQVQPQQTTTTPPKPVQPAAQTPSAPAVVPRGVAIAASVSNARMLQKRLAIGGRFYKFFDDKPNAHVVGILKDGTVAATGHNENGKCGVADWKDVVKVAACEQFTLGVKKDGTVLFAGVEFYRQYVSSWTDIVDVAIYSIDSSVDIAGVKKDGTVVSNATYQFKNFSNWRDIIAVSLSSEYLVGLKKDGTVVIDTSCISSTDYTEIKLSTSKWKDIVAISSDSIHIIGLKKDGTVVTTGYASRKFKDWKDIIAISSCYYNTVGLKKDGTVVFAGGNERCKGSTKWRDIVAVQSGNDAVIGLKSDGTLVSTAKTLFGHKCNFKDWKLF